MDYSKIQKSLSSFIIFLLLFSITFRVPFFGDKTYAWSVTFYNLVSIIVDTDTYSDIRSELDRYAKDIQSVLENTKVVIIPTPKETPAFNIASLNEWLYFEWYKGVDDSTQFESKLIWTVLVWDFNLPIVYDKNNSSRTIVPFTDFENKEFIYNHENNRYEKNEENIEGLKSEIWHWVISPNLWNYADNIKWLKDYFDKNHDFYSWTWNFQFSEWILNWDKTIWAPSNYEPFVFYFDQFREEKSLNYNSYQSYEWYIENKEDIVYNRFSKELADKLSNKTIWVANDEISKLAEALDPELAEKFKSSIPDTNKTPDIQTRHITGNIKKTFLEIFAKWVIWDFRTDVHNAWRYNTGWSEVNVDLIPYLITVLDLVNDEIIKEVNDEIEKEIDLLVEWGLSRKIALPTMIMRGSSAGCDDVVYKNYLYWTNTLNINSAEECSINRWSTTNWWQLVEANRGLNLTLFQSDIAKIWNNNVGKNKYYTLYFGWATPLNLNSDLMEEWIFQLNSWYDPKWSFSPVFDITWSFEIYNNSKLASPNNCFDNNYLKVTEKSIDLNSEESLCETSFRVDNEWTILWWVNDWSFNNNLNAKLNYNTNFESNYKTLSAGVCQTSTISLDWHTIKTKTYWYTLLDECEWTNTVINDDLSETSTDYNTWSYDKYYYKKIDSFVKHKSPNSDEIKQQIIAMTTPSLPIDRDRYIDFISAIWNYAKIEYPQLFRLNIGNNANDLNVSEEEDINIFSSSIFSEFESLLKEWPDAENWIVYENSFDNIEYELNRILDEKSEEINSLISLNDPSGLSGDNLAIYNYLKVWDYPSSNFDLLAFLKNKDDKSFTLDGETKTLSYYDTLVFSIYWNNLTSSSAKYSFIFDNYLTDQFWDDNSNYFLPKNKKEYEIAYLWAPWNAQNMYIKMDPEWKADNPYADIISDNINISSSLFASNIWSWVDDEEALFKCAPPDWVPIWEWIPAVMCWIWEMLPPTITLSDGVCWPSLLTVEEKEEIALCNWDANKNGINDCIESKLWDDWVLELNSDSSKYLYNKNAELKATIKDKNWNIVRLANATDIHFELIKIEAANDLTKELDNSNIKVVYDIDDISNNDNSALEQYVVFSNNKVRSQAWISNYWVWLKNKESNIYLRSYIKIDDDSENEAIFIESNILEIQIRGDRLFNSSYKLESSLEWLEIFPWINSLKVSDKNNIFLLDGANNKIEDISDIIANSENNSEKLVVLLNNISAAWNKIDIEYPLDVVLLKWIKEIEKLTITSSDLDSFKSLFSLEKSWSYSLEITDALWYKTVRNIELIAELPDSLDINLGSTIMQSWWNISTNFVTIYDKFQNPSMWEFYDINIEIDWNWIVFLDNESNNLNTSTYEWYKIFRLLSTDDTWDNEISISIFNQDWDKLIEEAVWLDVLDDIELKATLLDSNIKVWWWTYKYEINLLDNNWSLLSDFNSRVYMWSNPIFIESINPYVELVNWVAELEFKTKTVAWENISVEFQVEWLNEIVKKEITILPDDPMKMDLILSKNKIEASELSSSVLQVELKDRYNNLVFNDNSTITSIEILDNYSNIISPDKESVTVNDWKASYELSATINPWIAHFKIWTNPSLSLNSFTIEDENGELEINGVWESAWKIETYYFWNELKLTWKKYNSIYTTLLWSNYWDISEENYLAWSLLFEKDNRALAVTSLLNNSFEYNNILSLSENGNFQTIYSESDLSQDIEISSTFVNDKLWFNIFNKALNIYIWKLVYNFDDNNELIVCDDVNSSCISDDETSISLKTVSDKYNVYLDDNKLLLRDIYGKNILEILEDGSMNRFWTMDFEYDDENTSNYLSVKIKTGWNTIAELWFNFVDAISNISRDETIFNWKINNLENSILVLLRTNSYSTYNSWNLNNKTKTFYYNDPFAAEFSLNSFTKSNEDWVENFVNKAWIGWKEWNKSLLAFSAWKSVWESVQDYMSFSVINLWDPVISIKKIKKELADTSTYRKFDSTIWKLLSSDDNIESYKIFDYDNDSRSDILLIKDDKYLKLLENKNVDGWLLDKWNLAFITDLWNTSLVETWDFTWDWYDDIFFVNNDWYPYLLNNVSKDFIRYPLIENFDLDGRIVRAEMFDMDNDGKDDIVTLDDAWEINIFYGWGSSINPVFTKLTISDDNWIKINSEVRNDNSLVYFDWLYQPENWATENDRINNYLFVKYPYSATDPIIDEEALLNWDVDFNLQMDNIYLQKSEYSEYSWLKVEKIFRDINGWFISSGDTVEAEITLTNVSGWVLNNVIFAEKLAEIFVLNKESINSIVDFDVQDAELWYHFLIDNFDLNTNESITIKYEASVKPIQFSYIEVWLFEKDEAFWDDLYGDIIVKKDNKNCSNPVDIFRSLEDIGSRSYGQKWTKAPTCDDNSIELPPEIEKNTHDVNWNWIPDYIDELTDPNTDLSVVQDYANEQLDLMNLDSDNDWVPDSEDMFNLDDSIIIDLWTAWEKIDSALESVQDIMDWLSCWFGEASCFASPLNWAPLAPWNDPVFMWKLIWDWLKVDEWLPVFSWLTWLQMVCWTSPCCIPTVWPASPLEFKPWPTCRWPWAWWTMWVDSPTNFFRLFVTPTLTWWVWTAICFGWPASVAGNSVPKWLSPLAPGWNCIVVAKKLVWCEWGGSDWDPSSIWTPTYSGNGSFWIINWNCWVLEEVEEQLDPSQVSAYLDDSKDWVVENAFEFLPGVFSEEPIKPLFTDWWNWDVSVSLDFSSFDSGNFDDIVKIQMPRISSFPSWLMDWVTRQIEEIANKLTDFPTVFVILPDFSWIFDWEWGELSWNEDKFNADNFSADPTLNKNKDVKAKVKKVNSWIKEAYEFIGSTPLVYIEQETVPITVPWFSQTEANKVIAEWSGTVKQRETEIEKAKNAWSFWASCDFEDVKKQKECEKDNELSSKVWVQVLLDLETWLEWIKQNLEVIKSYKKIPEELNTLITKKEDYLEQVLCNIDIISWILGWRIWKNGERFKAWVELYLLIKATLKSWQLLVDVFADYDAECSECKNERQNGLDEEFSLIDALIPDIPVIQFPKWPDVVLDLHNIRAWLTVALPEFNLNTKPILLPSFPKLYLPEVPNVDLAVNLNLEWLLDIPILPSLEIPELPDLPTLPTIELPDLPPPPKLPKLLSEIEVVLDVIKLITKAMCVLKSSPLHPEWRAWDQIAFLTERSWYLSTDFFDVSMPEFSFPFLDAIKVTSYVNLEFETDYIVEMARQIALPINSYSNDFTNIFDLSTEPLDFRSEINTVPLNIEIWPEWIEWEVWLNNSDLLKWLFAKRVVENTERLVKYLDEWKDDLVTNSEFRQLVSKSLAPHSVTSNPKMDKIREVWTQVDNFTFSKEDSLIQELQDNNRAKFDALSDIINTEIIENKEFKKKLNDIWKSPIITKVAYTDDNKIEKYNDTLSKYNDKFIETAKKLVDWKWDNIKEELKKDWEELINSIKTPLEKYSAWKTVKTPERLLSAVSAVNSDTVSANSCQAQANSEYSYNYEWIYVVEWDDSYRLFDYLDELSWDELTEIRDIDNDSDEDLLYFANGQLFLKENLRHNPVKIYLSTNAIHLNVDDNKFYNWDIFYEAVNNVSELWSDSWNINLWFSAPTNKSINNFRIWFYNIVDKYLNQYNESYNPEFIRKDIIDAVADSSEVTKIEETEEYITRKNLVSIKNVWTLNWIRLKTNDLIDIEDSLSQNSLVNISAWTILYAWWDSFTIDYSFSDDEENTKSLTVSAEENIEMQKSIRITWITGNAYIESNIQKVYEWIDIRKHLHKPLFPGSEISVVWNISDGAYIELEYYDNSMLWLDFEDTKSWELYDLWAQTEDYYLRIDKLNDYYYLKINTFKENINWTLSKQILVAPQVEADEYAPELSMPSIRVPVYQNKLIDLTPYIYEAWWVKNISKVIVDFDLDVDSDWDGNKVNDDDTNLNWDYKDKLELISSLISLKLNFWIFDSIFKKSIWITLIDTNNNIWYNEVTLDVYTPVPQISDYNNWVIIWSINEDLTDEPIDLYRFRWWVVTKLEDTEWLTKIWTDNWNYSFNLASENTGLKLFKDWSEIASVDEKTWKITFNDFSLTTDVLSSNNNLNDNAHPKIIIKSNSEEIFYEYIKVDWLDKVEVVDSFWWLEDKWIYFQFTNKTNYNYYSIPETSKYNPWAISIYRFWSLDKEELFTIFKDWRINTVNENYKLEYDSFWEYVVIKLIDAHFNREVWKLLFIVESEYIMQ